MPLRPGPFKFQPKDINRLISSLIPTGQVIFQDDFEATTLKCRGYQYAGGATAGGSLTRDTSSGYPISGNACLLIRSGYDTVISTYGMLRELELGLFGNGKFGVEFWFGVSSSNLRSFRFELEIDSTTEGFERAGSVVYILADEQWYYRASDGTDKEITELPKTLDMGLAAWKHHFKMVLDFKSNEYCYVSVDGKKVNLKGKALEETVPAQVNEVKSTIYNSSPAGATGHALLLIDDLILTCNEP